MSQVYTNNAFTAIYIFFICIAKFADYMEVHELTVKTLIYKIPPPLV